ncbi:MAG: leucine-rich repeat domain-containing protein [Oscillospiraceae bacterium]|nr:leucine-rich repeat domain-containing protein [Oscillospiraceae bacterium]
MQPTVMTPEKETAMAKFEIRSGILAAYTPAPVERELTLPEGITGVACELDPAHTLEKLTVPAGSLVRLDPFFLQRSPVKEVHLSWQTLFIDAFAFWGCRSLEKVYLTEGTVVHPDAFNGCDHVDLVWQPQPPLTEQERAVMRSGVLMGYLFAPGETVLTVPEGVRSVAWHGVPGSDVLTKITIPPHSIVRLGENAFRDCTALREVQLSEETASVGAGAFRGCTALESMTVYDGTCVHPSAFEDGKRPFIVTGAAPAERFVIRNGVLYGCFFPEGVTDCNVPAGVERIAEEAFAGNDTMQTLTLPESLKEIGDSAFLDCTALQSVKLPEGLRILGRNAFCGCIALQSAVLPGSLRIVPMGAFEGCTALQSVTLPEGIRRIAAAAFHGCSITELHLPDSLAEVGKWAFTGNTALQGASLSDRTLADPGAFPEGMAPIKRSGAEQEPIPYDEMFCIRDGVLYDFCPQPDVTDIEIPPEVTVIEDKALCNIQTLTGVLLPETVQEIRIRDLRILGADSDFNACFWMCSRLTDLIYAPDTVLEQTDGYGFAAPRYVPALERIRLPELLGSHPGIGEWNGEEHAEGCRIRELVIPETGCETFRIDNCPALETIFVPGTVRNISIHDCPALHSIFTISDNTASGGNADHTTPPQAKISDVRHTPEVWDMLLSDAAKRQNEGIAALRERIAAQRTALAKRLAAPESPAYEAPVQKPVPAPAEPVTETPVIEAPAQEPSVPQVTITDPHTIDEYLLYYAQTNDPASEAYIAQHFREAARFLVEMELGVTTAVMHGIRIGTTPNKNLLLSLARRSRREDIIQFLQQNR